jgi:hypothetical protein
MTHAFSVTAISLLLSIVGLVAIEPCARHDAEHAARAIACDLESGLVGLMRAGIQFTADSGPQGGEARGKLCSGMAGCASQNATSRRVS